MVDAALGAMILLLCLPLLVWTTGLPTRLLWRNPDRILLLRPFEERGVSFSLKRFTKQNLAFRGFTLTLADKHLRHSLSLFLLAHLPLDLGDLLVTLYRPLFRRIHRYLFIRKSSDLRLLRFRLRLRYRLGSNWQSWLGLSDRITKIRSHNDLWRDCIDILMDNCQVIVVDVSDAGEGTLWEIEEVFRRQYLYKTLFIVRDGGQQAAANLLARIAADAGSVGSHALAPALHPYSSEEGALIRKGAFALEYAAAVSSARQPRVQPLPISRKAVFSLAPTLVIGPFWSPFGIVLAVSALREIDRSKGMIPGEYLAHLAILIHLVLFVGFLVAVFLPSLVS